MKEKRPLQRLSIEGFRSIRKLKPLSLRSGLNVLIGANGAGKSNFVGFFQMLGHMMDRNLGLQNFIAEGGQADAFLFRGVETTDAMSAKLWFNLNCYEFTLKASDDGRLFFTREVVHFAGPYFGARDYSLGTGHFESGLVTRKPKDLNSAQHWTLDTIKNWRVYHFHNTSRKAPMMRAENVVDNEALRPDAGNIAPFLLRMREEKREYYDRIVTHIQQAAPFFGDFVLKPDRNDQVQLLWKERYSEKIYYPHQLSDGTIRFVCLATLLLQPDPPSTIVIDEPELGLHPFAITILAGMFRLAEERAQLIVSTQSSPLVDHLNLDDLIVVDRKEGETVLSQPDEEDLSEWLQDYSLGELWDKNLLGGRPQK